MDLLNDKLAMIANNIETAILQSTTDIGDTVETTEGKKGFLLIKMVKNT